MVDIIKCLFAIPSPSRVASQTGLLNVLSRVFVHVHELKVLMYSEITPDLISPSSCAHLARSGLDATL